MIHWDSQKTRLGPETPIPVNEFDRQAVAMLNKVPAPRPKVGRSQCNKA
jgi:hypothetical protein